jgi:hypothetical protein
VADIEDYNPDLLPPVVVRYLEQHADPEKREAVAQLFAANARVVDEGITYDGVDAIRGWLGKTASAYTYTTTLLGQYPDGEERWVVVARLEGDFPGGVAELRYRVSVADDRIVDLVIAP